MTDKKREMLVAIFDQAYAPGSVSGGILKAKRLNTIAEWDEEGEARSSDQHVKSSVDSFKQSMEIFAKRRDGAADSG